MVEITVRRETTDEQLEEIKREFTPVLLKDVLKEFSVEEKLILQQRFDFKKLPRITLILAFLPVNTLSLCI
jgi:hypothetical protein